MGIKASATAIPSHRLAIETLATSLESGIHRRREWEGALDHRQLRFYRAQALLRRPR
jgi:hypothetical protein